MQAGTALKSTIFTEQSGHASVAKGFGSRLLPPSGISVWIREDFPSVRGWEVTPGAAQIPELCRAHIYEMNCTENCVSWVFTSANAKEKADFKRGDSIMETTPQNPTQNHFVPGVRTSVVRVMSSAMVITTGFTTHTSGIN